MSSIEIARAKPMYRYLMLLTIAMALGFQGWRSMLNNFAVEQAHFNGSQMGILQSVREIPGFLALLVVYILLVIREHKLAAVSTLLAGIGISLTGFLPSFYGLLLTTTLMSIGFHYFETTNQSLSLQYFSKENSAWVIAKMRSYNSAANVAVGLFIFFFVSYFDYLELYLFVGAPLVFIAIYCLLQNPTEQNLPIQHKKIVFHLKYWLFYALTFMSGARRQIFVAFAVFLLVEKFSLGLREIALLFIINNIITYFFNPLVGKWILRFGERNTLFFEYSGLILIFLGYAIFQSKYLIMSLYILDHIFFSFGIAIKTYFQKIADPKDIAPSIAVGFTINHIAAVIIPASFGMLWLIDYRIPFYLGAVMAGTSLILSRFIPKHNLAA